MEALSLTSAILTLLLLIILHFANRFIFKPLAMVYYYSKQGFRPTYLPILGEMSKLDALAEKYGDCHYPIKKAINEDPKFIGTTSPLGDKCTITLANIKYIKPLIQAESGNMIKYPSFIWPWQEYVTKTSLTFLEGEVHKRTRRILSKSFHFDFLKRNIPVITEITKEAFDDMEKSGLNDLCVLEEMGAMTGETIGRTFFGFDHRKSFFRGRKITDAVFDVETEASKLSQTLLYQIFGGWLVKLQLTPYHRRITSLFKEFREFCSKFVVTRKAELRADKSKANMNNLIDGLLLQQFEDEKESLSDDEILDQYVVFFLAGQQTTAHWLTMVLYCLARHPEHIEKLREEIKKNIADVNNLDYNDMVSLPLLNAVLKEVLRLYPPLQMVFFREAVRDFTVGDLKIHKGTLINVFLGHAAYNEKFFKDYNTFDPTRWIGQGEGSNIEDQFNFIPFYAGVRNCIGQHLSWLEARVIMIQLISRYNFSIRGDYELKMTQRLAYEPIQLFHMDFVKV